MYFWFENIDDYFRILWDHDFDAVDAKFTKDKRKGVVSPNVIHMQISFKCVKLK